MFKKLKEFFKNQKGFSLMELIVVIAILGVIASIAVPNVLGAIDNARKNTDRTNAAQIARAITTALAEGKSVGADATEKEFSTLSNIVPDYIQSVPKIQSTSTLYNNDTSFYVKIVNDVVTVSAHTDETTYKAIFPTPAVGSAWAD